MKTLDNDTIKAVIAEAKKAKHDVVVRDIAYVVLCETFIDKEMAYKVVFGASAPMTYEEYVSQKKVSWLTRNVPLREADASASESMTYDEIKTGLEDDLRRLEKLRDENASDLDAKDMVTIVKQISDIRVKLKEKFGTTAQQEERRVVVESKFTKICPYCHHEV